MQKLLPLLAYFLLFGIVTAGLTSCKDDDDEPSRVTLSFSSSSKEVGEGEQGVKVNLVLDKPAPADLIIEYSISGTATRKVGLNAGDFEIVGSAGEVEIAKGATTGSIELNILTDNILEQNETIILTLEDVSSALVDIGDKDQVTLTIVGGGNVTASFATATSTVNEADEEIHEITVQIDQANGADVVVTYSIKSWFAGQNLVPGVAIDSLTGAQQEMPRDYWDYYIDGESGKVTIPAGETSATIRFNVYSDFFWENDETIEFTLEASTGITPGTNKKHTVTIKQESGKAVELDWNSNSADMDMFLWVMLEDDNENPLNFNIAWSIQESNEGPEGVFIPEVFSSGLSEEIGGPVQYGASYVYYSGTSDPLDFIALIGNVINGVPDQLISEKSARYTLANINQWDKPNAPEPIIVQTFQWSNGNITNVSDITVPTEGSRPRTATISKLAKRAGINMGSKRFAR